MRYRGTGESSSLFQISEDIGVFAQTRYIHERIMEARRVELLLLALR
jgi:hypothetical protein